MALSDTWLKAQLGKAREGALVKSDRDGLGVRVSPKGKLTFQLRYRHGGKPGRMDLGSYPLMSLKEARERCQKLRAAIEEGHDPRMFFAAEKFKRSSAHTIEGLFREWYDAFCVHTKKAPEDILRSFEIHVFPKVGRMSASDTPLHAWLEVLEPLAKTRSSICVRVLTNAKQMYKWAIKRHLIETNPLAFISAKEDLRISKNKGNRVLSDEEIKYLWEALEHSRIHPRNQIWIKMCLLYGCRLGEIRLSHKAHFDLKKGVWTVPPENHKMGAVTRKPLLRPLLPVAVEWVREASKMSNSPIFLITAKGSDKPPADRAHLSLSLRIQQWVWRHRQFAMEHWSMHDLRRTARTNFSSLTEYHIAEIMLGHALPGQHAVYDHYDYLEEQREAYEKWWERMSNIVS